MNFDSGNSLIIDIGGGSVEFIISDGKKSIWHRSFDLGAALLHEKFNIPDPIGFKEFQKLTEFIQISLMPLSDAISKYTIERLVAASGTLDALAKLARIEFLDKKIVPVSESAFNNVCEAVIGSSLEERLQMPDMMQSRAKLLPLALMFLKTLTTNFDISFPIYMSNQALQEGVIIKMLQEDLT